MRLGLREEPKTFLNFLSYTDSFLAYDNETLGLPRPGATAPVIGNGLSLMRRFSARKVVDDKPHVLPGTYPAED